MTGNAPVSVRRFRDEDAGATARIFCDAVHQGAARHYDEAQRRAWAPGIPDLPAWRDRLGAQAVFVAERQHSVVGFMTLRPDGCIDLAFVAPDAMGTGVARQLYDAILREAARQRMPTLHTHASHLARPFFERQGWTMVREQTVQRDGVSLTNFFMEISLTGPASPAGRRINDEDTVTQPLDVERATELYRQWLTALKAEANLQTHNQSQAMMRAVMHRLRRALAPDQVLRVANALPALPRGIFIEGWSLDETREGAGTAESFFRDVHHMLRLHHAPPQTIVRDVFAVWHRFLAPASASTIRSCLPSALTALWPDAGA